MNTVGQKERNTQNRIVQFFQDHLNYRYLGDWEEREGNSNVELEILETFLRDEQGYDDALIKKALFEVEQLAANQTNSLYDVNKEFYRLLRYGVKVKTGVGENTETVWLINWKDAVKNDFAIAEEVTVAGKHDKRPDIVLYVNGIALGVLELKRSTVSVSEGIRQNLDSQRKEFIRRFFNTMQFVMAGNDSEGLRYGTIETPEKYYLTWKEENPDYTSDDPKDKKYLPMDEADGVTGLLDCALLRLMDKKRILDIIHNFIVFDSGVKKICRHNQFFALQVAKGFVRDNEGGIIWHTQGSGKSLTMVWLTKWIRENVEGSRVLVVTDRTELDEQIEGVFHGVDEKIHRTKSGADLIEKLNDTNPFLICSLIHKFGGKEDEQDVGDIDSYLEELTKAIPSDFEAKGNICVFVDECHRTQSGKLHQAMRSLLPDALILGFTGTPLLKEDKKRSIEVFGRYVHTYKFDEAVKDGVVLDLRYEARDVDQRITSPDKIDQWFEAKTRGLTDLAKAQLKQRWGTMQKVLSCQDRLEKIVADVLLDMETKPRLMDGRGNALLVSASIYQACKYYELFCNSGFAGKCAIVTSYKPSHRDIKGEETGEGLTEKLRQLDIYRKMLAEWFNQDEDSAMKRVEEFEDQVKEKFKKEPGQMKLLIVVDKLLTGFDAPSATYLYIDKSMRDHGLFQAICRVNRLDGDDKEYGFVIDYKDLFQILEKSIKDYTAGAFDKFDKEDVAGLIDDRLEKGKERLEELRESVKALCEPVAPPKEQIDYFHYFSCQEAGNAEQLKENEPKRLTLYRMVASLIRAFANIANELSEAGYTNDEIQQIREEVKFYESLRNEIKKHSGDAIDLKMYEPAMRHLIDTYIRAEESEVVSQLDDMSLIELIVERGEDAVDTLPDGIRGSEEAVAETIENNVRRLILDANPINPKYYDRMSDLLDALIEERRAGAVNYRNYLQRVVALTRQSKSPPTSDYPTSIDTKAKQALYDNIDSNEELILKLDEVIIEESQDGWKGNPIKIKKVRSGIRRVLGDDDELVEKALQLAINQDEY